MNKKKNSINNENLLNSLFLKYNTKDFIINDPIQFPHRYSKKKDIELAAFVSALLAQGRRTAITKNLNLLFDYIGTNIYDYITDFDYGKERNKLTFFSHFAYRTITSDDLTDFLFLISLVVKKYGSLENLLLSFYDDSNNNNNTITNKLSQLDLLKSFISYFYNLKLPNNKEFSPTLKMILANPTKGSACKRLNMFFRWMVRDDGIDFGLYKFIDKSDIIIPLDTHVAKISREIGLIPPELKSNSMKTAILITGALKKIDKNDPVKYDFALFGYGIDK